MRREIRLYNMILPVWLLWLFPQVWLVVLPGNLAVDCLVLWLSLLVLRRTDKRDVMRPLWWRFWLRGFAADFAGVLWMLLGGMAELGLDRWGARDGWFRQGLLCITYNAFEHPLAFCWTAVGVAIAGVCVYRLDRKCLDDWSPALSDRERHGIALAMAVVTAPWTFFIPVY